MNKLYFFNKSNYELTEKQKYNVIHDINTTNLTRMNIILIIFVLIEILFILFNDIPYMITPSSNIIWNDNRFFILHLLLLFVSIAGLIIIKILNKYKEHNLKNIYLLLISILTILLLCLVAIVNGFDQVVHQNISSVFIANLIIFSCVILMRFPLNLAIYSLPFLIYLSSLVIFQDNYDLIISNSINGLIFFLAAIIISTTIYNNHYDKIVKNLILEETNLKLTYLSNHDPLTGLLNRRSFLTLIDEKMESKNKNKRHGALILLDIDYFKQVNDKFGHPAGDIVLKEISNILLETIKTNDLATRLGGEEFLVFLFESSIEEAYELADTIRLAIYNKIIYTGKFKIKVTASFGVTILKNNLQKSFETSYKAADLALYQAKNQGRNMVIMDSLNVEE